MKSYITIRLSLTMLATCLLAACAGQRYQPEAPPEQPASAPVLNTPAPTPAAPTEPVAQTPTAAETALADGLKFYQAGKYKLAETQLKVALQAGLNAPADLANAHKHLAFIYCTSKRDKLCAAAFKAAKDADPAFALSKAEAGHPMWARTYKKALGLK